VGLLRYDGRLRDDDADTITFFGFLLWHEGLSCLHCGLSIMLIIWATLELVSAFWLRCDFFHHDLLSSDKSSA